MATKRTGRKGNPDALKAYREKKRQQTEEQETASASGVQLENTELTGDFAALATALRQAQQEKSADEALRVITDAMTKLDDDALSRITSTPIVQALIERAATKGTERLPPGSYIRDNQGRVVAKIPWTAQDILDTYPMVTFTPAHTIPVTFNGHTVNFAAFEEITCPAIFKEVYMHSIEATREQGEANRRALMRHFGESVVIDVGWRPTAQ